MTRWFGDIDQTGPLTFLQSHGYELTADWFWKKPTPSHTIHDTEWQCLSFLVEEWDFGGIEGTLA